ncbi:DUF2690 domain-containing protein [Streptomyces sp. NPDC020794]|uniref:helix-turn-helix domain-containing protein n=1 Tax=unclassified Streptomyces TaxID=2593676 RepID=UPI0036E2E2BD
MSGATWRPLPPSLDPQTAYLVGVLRELKDRSGLSLTALAARTPYSRSSWDRYLGGVKFPPRDAVEMLGRLAGEPPERLVALWQHAEARSSGRDAQPVTGADTPANTARQDAAPPRPASGTGNRSAATHRFRLGMIVAAVVAVVAWACAQVFGPPPDSALSAGSGPFKPVPLTVGCRGDQCRGREASAMACDVDAASYADLRIGLSHVELRMSPNCAAAWARISYSSVGDRVTVQDRAGRGETATVIDEASTEQYVVTHMLPVHSPTQVRACWKPRAGGSRCTPWGRTPQTPAPGRSDASRSSTRTTARTKVKGTSLRPLAGPGA